MDCIDVNYAIHLPGVDRVMGTFKRPPPGVWPEEDGVIKLETVPQGLVPQALRPLGPKKTHGNYVRAATTPEP